MDARQVERSHGQLGCRRDSGTRLTLRATTCAHGDLVSFCHDLDDRNNSRDKRFISAYSVRSTVHMIEKAWWVLHPRQEKLVAMNSYMVPTRKQRDLGPELDVDTIFQVSSLMSMSTKLGTRS